MHEIELAIVLFVYATIILCALFASLMVKNILGSQRTIDPIKKMFRIVLLVLGIYFLPIVILAFCLASYEHAVGLLIGIIILSVFPVTKYIIIPLVDTSKSTIESIFPDEVHFSKRIINVSLNYSYLNSLGIHPSYYIYKADNYDVNCYICERSLGFWSKKYKIELNGTGKDIQRFLDYLKSKNFKIKL